MWYVMSQLQSNYELSERLIRAVSQWEVLDSGLDSVEELLDAGADVNGAHGTLMPLHCAAMVADVTCMTLLLDRGAQVDAIDGYGRSALHYAAEKDPDCVSLLLSRGCHPDIPDSNGNTALHWASFRNKAHCIQALLQNGASVNILDYNRNTPLNWAAMHSRLEAIRVLLDYNASPNIKNYDDLTPLMRIACLSAAGLYLDTDEPNLVLLMRASGQFDVRNPRGQLPEVLANDESLSSRLIEHCANPCSLLQLSRYAIRQQLGQCYLPDVVPKLPVPETLHRFILLHC